MLYFFLKIKTIKIMTQRNVQKQGWVFPLFSPDSDDRLSLNFHRFVIYISCDTRSVSLGQYCLPKVSNGFKKRHTLVTRQFIVDVCVMCTIKYCLLAYYHHHHRPDNYSIVHTCNNEPRCLTVW